VFGGETHEHRRPTWICGDRARGRYDDGYGTRWMMMMTMLDDDDDDDDDEDT
jgi:hypothetical protein